MCVCVCVCVCVCCSVHRHLVLAQDRLDSFQPAYRNGIGRGGFLNPPVLRVLHWCVCGGMGSRQGSHKV